MRYFLLFFLSFHIFAEPVFEKRKSDHLVVKRFNKIHKRFFKEVCNGSYNEYEKLLKEFRGTGYFIPVINETRLDSYAVSKNLHLVKNKINFINNSLEKLKKVKNFKEQKSSLEKLESSFKEYNKVKSKYFFSEDNKSELLIEGGLLLKKFQEDFYNFIDTAYFLKPYGFPVNHLSMRSDFDYYKQQESIAGQKKKNSIFFKRQVFEDGAQNPRNGRSDKFLRTVTNSLGIRVEKQGPLIAEDFRYDMDYFLKAMNKNLNTKVKMHEDKLEEWLNRTQKTYEFYQSLMKKENAGALKEQIQKKSKDKFALKDFTLKKQKQVYEFWMKEKEINQALFVLETILFNEVGDIDGKDMLERRDVIQVVLNRLRIPFYRSLTDSDSLFPYLKDLNQEKVNKSIWLNALLKEGEFSFTYFFISSSKHIYCPDMSKRGRYLRKKNIDLILNVLDEPNYEFSAIRYFSRASMVGRIDMSSIWSDYKSIPERPGKPAPLLKRKKRLYNREKFDYLYQFKDPSGEVFYVLKIGDSYYSMRERDKKFFTYRNPHYFTYFEPK